MELPKELFELYRQGVLNRQEFKQKFSEWQRNNGYNDVKGYATSDGVFIEYKGEKAKVEGNLLICPTVGDFRSEVFNADAYTTVKAFKEHVDWWLSKGPYRKRQYDVDRTGDPKDTVEYLYPDTAAFNCLSSKEQSKLLNH